MRHLSLHHGEWLNAIELHLWAVDYGVAASCFLLSSPTKLMSPWFVVRLIAVERLSAASTKSCLAATTLDLTAANQRPQAVHIFQPN